VIPVNLAGPLGANSSTTLRCASRFAGVTAWTYLSIVMLTQAWRISPCTVATSAPLAFKMVPKV
jgi:hypothetical protein